MFKNYCIVLCVELQKLENNVFFEKIQNFYNASKRRTLRMIVKTKNYDD